MKDEVKWHQKNLLRQVNLFWGLYTIGGTVFAYLCAQEPILIFFLIFLIPLGVICMLGLLIGLLLQMRKIEKVAVDKTAYRTWNTKVAKLLLSWIIIFIVGIAGGIQLGKYTVLRQENSLIVPLQKELTQKYHQAGFMGDIKVTKVGRDRTEAGSGYYGSYTYTEKLEPGKTYQKKLWVNFKPSELEQIDIGTKALRKGELDSRYQRSTESLVALKESAAQQQPAVKVELKQIKQQFKTLFPKEKITNIGVCMYPFEETDPKFQKVAAVIAKNQQKKLPLGGYYNLDIPQFVKEGLYYYYVDIATQDPYAFNTDSLRELSYVGLPDGNYRLRFEAESPYAENGLELQLQNGEIVKLESTKYTE